jgi:predicted ATPase
LAESTVSDNATTLSKISKCDAESLREKDWESLSLSSMSTMNTVKTASGERLNEICDELGAPRGFLQIVGYHLLGHTKKKINVKEKAPILDEIVDFMAKLFIHCTAHADLTIVALDDMHHTDTLSWKVVQRIFETGENILFVCGSRPLGSRVFSADDEFWKNLTGVQRESDRFQELDIGPLNRFEVAKMASIALSCKVHEVDKQFAKDIFDHTRGMPHFAAQALENCKRKGLYERLENNKIGWRKDTAEVRRVEVNHVSMFLLYASFLILIE